MDFWLSDEQRELKEAAAAFARAKLNQDLAKREEAGGPIGGRAARGNGRG